jgi:hypothetical protein
VTPVTKPLNVAFTYFARAFVAGALVSGTRRTNVIPATYVLLPVWYVGAPEIANAACALIAITRLLFVNGPNDRPEISSVPITVAVIVTVGWLGALVANVIWKLR